MCTYDNCDEEPVLAGTRSHGQSIGLGARIGWRRGGTDRPCHWTGGCADA